MDKQKKKQLDVLSIVLFTFFFALLTGGASASSHSHNHKKHHNLHHHHQKHHDEQVQQHNHDHMGLSKLFVFGDSYVDTGNNQKAGGGSWSFPYGMTFPGRPTGRYSDGRVFTDFIASFVGVKSPLPFKLRKYGKPLIPHGMNFAHGGTGVFNTLVPEPNMTTQIDTFTQLLKDGWYTKHDLNHSMALLSVAGNDYGTFLFRNGSDKDLPAFITKVVTQIGVNLVQVHGLGVKKVVVMGLQPLGCLPSKTAPLAYQKCQETQNTAVGFHNLLLQQVVEKLNNETTGSPFHVLDLYTPFMSVLDKQGPKKNSGHKFENPLKPCCLGISDKYSCGSVDNKGEKKYTICENPKSAFFWDGVHPTQQGWKAVYAAMQPSLDKLYY
ncbi:hypothetical protein MKW98_031090 [Papaver atlanticum]|uniref:GDSL esterase/lipase n=1 Tax=Papaver atlanticum TaxID=357466 RepID=A0AAD4SV26_9MAGN|nr:hypothetical protein MKW98_031090 [Papaver atlanticum]